MKFDAGQRMLFVGNSFTFFWNTPQLVEAMARDQGVSLDAYQSTANDLEGRGVDLLPRVDRYV